MGEPAPLPHDLAGAARIWVIAAALLGAGYLVGRTTGVLGTWQRSIDAIVEDALRGVRRGGGSSFARRVDELLPWELLIVLRWSVAVAIAAFRRWRHLAVFVGSVAVVTVLAQRFPTAGVSGSGVPGQASEAMAGTAVTLVGVVYALAPPGAARRWALAATAVVLALVGAFLLLKLENTVSEVVVGLAMGVAVPFLAYRVLTPEAVFPVALHPGRTAHLDLTDRRRSAIERAIADQLGLEVTAIERFGLGASGGCTPLQITLADGSRLFGKLYATSHLRADRWYKLGRAIRFGALEDERSFNSVRRMVEYEDHMLRYLRDQGIRAPEPLSFVELSPEREYLFLCAFVDDAAEIDRAPVDDEVLRSGISLARGLWNAGVAHRDIKPGNLLVTGRRVVLIDVFFCQIRPSPWRQSVDLANMLLTLALRSDADRVYRLALERFTPDEIAEAFAASHGVTIPSQLRRAIAADGRDLVTSFRALAPRRAPIPIQRWTIRRIALTVGLAAVLGAAAAVTAMNLGSAGF